MASSDGKIASDKKAQNGHIEMIAEMKMDRPPAVERVEQACPMAPFFLQAIFST